MMSRPAYPIFLDVSGCRCVIIGGGAVAVRKAHSLVDAGAQQVDMVAPSFAPNIPKTVRQIEGAYSARYLEDARLVFAATNVPDVNNAVVRDAKERGIFVSRADNDDDLPGDFVSAARLDRGPVTVAVSAGSAALAVMIRDEISDRWDQRWTDLAQAMIELRPEIKDRWDEPTRRSILRDLAGTAAADIVADRGVSGLREWIDRKYGPDRRGAAR